MQQRQQRPTRLEKHARQTGCGSTWLHYSIFIMRHVRFINNSYDVCETRHECVRTCVRCVHASTAILRLSVCLWHFSCILVGWRRTVHIPIPCEDNDSFNHSSASSSSPPSSTVKWARHATHIHTARDSQTLHADCASTNTQSLHNIQHSIEMRQRTTIHSPRNSSNGDGSGSSI